MKKDDWEKGLEKFNKRNPAKNDTDDVENGKFQLEESTNLRKLTNLDMLTYSTQVKDNPSAQQILNFQTE